MLILQKKINQLSSSNPIYRSKDADSTIQSMNKIINLIKDLIFLEKEHHIENYLYYGGAINKIYNLLGEARLSRWLAQISKDNLTPKVTWSKLCTFLEDELKIQQQKLAVKAYSQDNESKFKRPGPSQDPPKTSRAQRYGYSSIPNSIHSSELTCFICDAKEVLYLQEIRRA